MIELPPSRHKQLAVFVRLALLQWKKYYPKQ